MTAPLLSQDSKCILLWIAVAIALIALILALAVVAALLQFGNWYGLGAVAVVYGIRQFVESFHLTPRLVGERIGLHPLVVIFALLAFGQLFGFFGVLLALPTCAVLLVGARQLRRVYLASDLYRHQIGCVFSRHVSRK